MAGPWSKFCAPRAVLGHRMEWADAKGLWTLKTSGWEPLSGRRGGNTGVMWEEHWQAEQQILDSHSKMGWIGILKGNILVQAWQKNVHANYTQFCHFYAKRTQMVFSYSLETMLMETPSREEATDLLRAAFRVESIRIRPKNQRGKPRSTSCPAMSPSSLNRAWDCTGKKQVWQGFHWASGLVSPPFIFLFLLICSQQQPGVKG